ncbi:RagB/SusD family nutrient uptake outer membrane protein [Pontibacter sp. BT731]|uniref:RagB/SusD family nutrient uptake outer membrane protein n=1 Tax=Pontibacter coccineus TaxID=3063328 RepID=UPI0026E38BA2|nr:RagB/SusD family nutrient uptake outer membrane protein [Pontibacter sp. BT731]MDO6390273.1 RagB/SusD family nutrient uptake outer membrane protein [Pontibacter sp. BT731]
MRIKHLFIGLGLSCSVALSSCEEVIEVEPEFQRDADFLFTNLDDYEFALTGAYARFRNVAYYGSGAQTTGTWSQLPDMMSDNLVQTSEDLANWSNQSNWVYTSDEDDVAQAWLAAYSVITQANIVLRNIDNFSTENPGRVNRLKGQALAIRAMAHFDLLRYWAVSYDRSSTELGVTYVESVNPEAKPARETVQENYNKIFRDLQEAETLLGNVDKAINGSNRAFIDQVVVKAILARVNLYAKNYDAAETYATQVIDARPLATRAQFPGVWTDASKAGVIWAVNFNAGEGSASSGTFNGPSNRNRFRPSAELLEKYTPSDVRTTAYFGTRNLSGNPRTVMTKFLSRGAASDNLVDWKVFRTAEMYLIRAEARAMKATPDLIGAVADLHALRAARIEGYNPLLNTPVGVQATMDAIALERRKELIGEGHRFFDLKRTTRTITRVDCGTTATNCTLASTAREWAWPIPQGEIDANPTLENQQTTGY